MSAIQVTFESVGPGTCGWCRKDKETVYHVAFADKSFAGPMCKADLLRAVEMKCPPRPAIPMAAPAHGQPAALVGNGATK